MNDKSQSNLFDGAIFSVFGQPFVYSANTLTYFPLTECASNILQDSEYFANGTIGRETSEKYSALELEMTLGKLVEFKKNGILDPLKARTPGDFLFGDFCLKLIPTLRCNLRCEYCFSNKRTDYDMSLETARKAINFFLKQFVPHNKGNRYIIDLTGSGEPLLRLDFILDVNAYVLQLKKEYEINIFCQLATNGMLLSPDVSSILKKNMILYGVSLDGEKKESSAARTGLDYDLVVENINKIENKQFLGLAATYSADNHDFVKIFSALYKLSPEVVGMKPVRASASSENSINEGNIASVKMSYDTFLLWIYEQAVSGKETLFATFINGEDYLAKFLKTTARPLRLFYRCAAGVSSMAVDAKGNILPCAAFVGDNSAIIGHIDSGLSEEAQIRFKGFYADRIEYCKSCWARYVCGGECFVVGHMDEGEYVKPNPTMCDLKQHLVKLSVYFWTRMRYDNPRVYEKILEKI